MPNLQQAYTQGFMDKCAQAGIDPEQLVKVAQNTSRLSPEDLAIIATVPYGTGAMAAAHAPEGQRLKALLAGAGASIVGGIGGKYLGRRAARAAGIDQTMPQVAGTIGGATLANILLFNALYPRWNKTDSDPARPKGTGNTTGFAVLPTLLGGGAAAATAYSPKGEGVSSALKGLGTDVAGLYGGAGLGALTGAGLGFGFNKYTGAQGLAAPLVGAGVGTAVGGLLGRYFANRWLLRRLHKRWAEEEAAQKKDSKETGK